VTTTGRREGRGDAASTRAALLRAARELFSAQGFDRTTVRAIAERADVNQALLFRYFGSKDALFTAVLADEVRELLAATAPEDLLAATVERMFDDDRADPFYAALRSPGHETALAALRNELGAPYQQVFAGLAARGAERRTEGGTDDAAESGVEGGVEGGTDDAVEGGTEGGVEPDPDAALRADLLLAWLFGIGFARSVLRTPSLVEADAARVTALMRAAAASLLGSGDD
jgi:AcrR family transcriptional regulator